MEATQTQMVIIGSGPVICELILTRGGESLHVVAMCDGSWDGAIAAISSAYSIGRLPNQWIASLA